LYGNSLLWVINANVGSSENLPDGWTKTIYTNGRLWLTGISSKWGDGLNDVPISTVTVFSKLGSQSLEFQFQTVTVANGYTYNLSGYFDSTAGGIYSKNNDTGNLSGYEGYGYSWVRMEVAAVPIPAAAWLLGTGILGIVALKRRSMR
jgi:hypothetical protein